MICAAVGPGDDVIDLQMPRLKVRSAPGAIAFLKAVERRLVTPVERQFAQVRPFRNVGAMHSTIEQSQFVAHPALDQLGGLLADVDASPLAAKLLRSDARRGTPAEGIEDHVAEVARCLDDAPQQSKRLLFRIANPFFRRSRQGRHVDHHSPLPAHPMRASDTA